MENLLNTWQDVWGRADYQREPLQGTRGFEYESRELHGPDAELDSATHSLCVPEQVTQLLCGCLFICKIKIITVSRFGFAKFLAQYLWHIVGTFFFFFEHQLPSLLLNFMTTMEV